MCIRDSYYCVINLEDPEHQSANTGFSRIRSKYGDWFRRKTKKYNLDYKSTYVYSFENPNNNIHVNWCLHIPDELEAEFLEKLSIWVEKVQGTPNDTTIYTEKIVYGVDAYKATANYIMKGGDPEYGALYFLDQLQEEHGDQGKVYGKRAGFSISIGVTAQKRAKFNARKYKAKRKTFKITDS